MKEYKGHYCKNCHNYFRVYLDASGRAYSGQCNKCGRRVVLPTQYAEMGFFSKGSVKEKDKINVWDHYDGGQIIGTIEVGTAARLLQQRKIRSILWYQITTGKITGWVSGQFIRKLK